MLKGQWLPNKKLKQLTSSEKLELWKDYKCLDKTQTAAIIWEFAFQIPIDAEAGRYTNAFFMMAQTLERLMYQLYKKDNWLEKEWIVIPEELRDREIGRERFHPRLEELIKVWGEHYCCDSKFNCLLDKIREKRNRIVHDAEGVTVEQIVGMWSGAGLEVEPLAEALLIPLRRVVKRIAGLPEVPLLSLLYEWGLEVLGG